jgi:hypothetical protein
VHAVMMEHLLFRAAGWLAEPKGEALSATKELIQALVAEIKRLTPIAEERDELVLEVARLQHALAFWLPHVPANDSPRAKRCGDDALLLFGCDCQLEPGAEELGWITMHEASAAPTPADNQRNVP